jgi:sulfur-carrier protein adenylyltransferase/sulfurtransferase
MLSPPELARYARHLAIPEFGIEGQQRLHQSSILLLGAGGLGSPAALYLAAAGIGRLGIVDPDHVDLTNLQRQILHGQSSIGRPKTDSAADRLRDTNPHVQIDLHPTTFRADNAATIAAPYDLIIDGTDNFPARYLANDIAFWAQKPLVYGAIHRFEGQLSVFAPHLGGPCYRCLFPSPPDPGTVPSCAEAGVLGVLPGIVGALQATEAIKLLTGIGDPLIGSLLHFDALRMRFTSIRLKPDPACPLCSPSPTITAPIDYHHFCGLTPSASSPSQAHQHTPATAPTFPSISVHDLQLLRQARQPHLLIDVREDFERLICHIPDARPIPLAQLPDHLPHLPAGIPLYIHCKSGHRSLQAVQQLHLAGLTNATNIEGGILAWIEQIDPSLTSY